MTLKHKKKRVKNNERTPSFPPPSLLQSVEALGGVCCAGPDKQGFHPIGSIS